MFSIYDLCIKKYSVKPENIYFIGPKAIHHRNTHQSEQINTNTTEISTSRRLYITQEIESKINFDTYCSAVVQGKEFVLTI
jgi:hypothetical protein